MTANLLDRGELDAATHDALKPPIFASAEEERAHRKARLAGACRIFARFGYDHWVAGHLTQVALPASDAVSRIARTGVAIVVGHALVDAGADVGAHLGVRAVARA